MTGGILLIVAGVWVLTQVFGGDALARLKITSSSSGDSGSGGSGTTPAPVPAPAPSSGGLGT